MEYINQQNSESTIIKGGTVVTPEDVKIQDILIRNGLICLIGDLSDVKADKYIDAEGLFVMPGAVDTHVHFNDVFMNTISVHDYYTGTLAAAYGGVTSIIDFSNQVKGKSLVSTIKQKKEEAKGKALIDWGVHPVITRPDQQTLDEIALVVSEGAPTIKCYMTYRDEGLLINNRDLRRIAKQLKKAGGMLMLHAEDNRILEDEIKKTLNAGLFKSVYHAKSRPVQAELIAIEQAIRIAEESGSKVFIVHMSVAEGAEMIHKAVEKNINILAETCTHYLVFDEKYLEREDGIKWICSPPLRNSSNQALLWEKINNSNIKMVSSDDAAFSWEAKLFGKDRFDKCPNGIPGVETRFSILYSEGVVKNRISLSRFVELVSSEPARIFGMAPQKGSLLPGADADIVLFNPNEKWIMDKKSLHMNTDWSAYENIAITGKIKKVFSRGELIIDGEICLAKKGRGKYLHRKLKL
ncbi:dihydropyrimidinase [Bacteroidota bacterium]